MKKFTAILLIAVMLTVSLGALAYPPTDEINVYLDGERLDFDVPPVIVDGRTLVPARSIFEALEFEIEWTDETQTVRARRRIVTVASRHHLSITMQIGNANMSLAQWVTPEPTTPGAPVSGIVWDYNTYTITLDVPPIIVDSRTLVPLRAISEATGAEVDWCGETQTVLINTAH